MRRFILGLAVLFSFLWLAAPSNLHAQADPVKASPADALAAAGEYDKAIAAYNRALQLDPKSSPDYDGRGLAWFAKGEYDKALTDFNRAIRLEKQFNYYNNRGSAWYAKHDYGKAVADFNQAIRLDPNDPHAYSWLGWLQATCPDQQYRNGRTALKNANRAAELTGGKTPCCSLLAAAYAETGDFDKARQWISKAIGLAKDEKIKKVLRSQLELYKKYQPCREADPFHSGRGGVEFKDR